jgi:hypothetical protein
MFSLFGFKKIETAESELQITDERGKDAPPLDPVRPPWHGLNSDEARLRDIAASLRFGTSISRTKIWWLLCYALDPVRERSKLRLADLLTAR